MYVLGSYIANGLDLGSCDLKFDRLKFSTKYSSGIASILYSS